MEFKPLEQLVDALDALHIAYAIGGSVASSTWSIPRSTHDTDLLLDLREADLPRLVRRLSGSFYADIELAREAFARKGAFNVIHLATHEKFDLFIAGSDLLDREQLSHKLARKLELTSERLYHVTSPELMILRKLDWFRSTDETSDRQWRDVLSILRIQHERLDHALITSIAARAGLAELLERARAQTQE